MKLLFWKYVKSKSTENRHEFLIVKEKNPSIIPSNLKIGMEFELESHFRNELESDLYPTDLNLKKCKLIDFADHEGAPFFVIAVK